MFISQEIDDLLSVYSINPFGDKKDKRINLWLDLLDSLPLLQSSAIDLVNEVGVDDHSQDIDQIEGILLQFLPWRKGPFRINQLLVDSEWNSDMKWKRFQSLGIDLAGKSILDVGSGNGYYAFRMLGMGANQVLCLEPNLMHLSQFLAINKLIGPLQIKMIPERLEDSGIKETKFDCIFSMGLLYHQRNPKEHLKILKEFLKPNGQIIIETIVAPEEYDFALEPSDRYASMPNVHFVHSDKGCKAIFDELGLRLVMETKSILTNHLEQRKTRWMPFKSFEAALKPDDPSLTIEGYPAPSRKFYLLEISS